MKTVNPSAPPRRLIRLRAITELLGVDASTVYRWERRGFFPRRFSVGPNSTAWFQDEVVAWLDARAARQTDTRSPNPRAHLETRDASTDDE